jgi:catalase-peroxidase
MGLIYVNPKARTASPTRWPRPRHARNLRPHGHERRGDRGPDRRRPHLRQGPRRGRPAAVGPEPEGAPIEAQGLGWINSLGSGKGGDTITSGIEGAWKPNPTTWDNGYFDTLFGYEWELTKSPAGAHQWVAKNVKPEHMIPDAHDPNKKHAPMMTTADLSLRFDPIYEKIARRFHQDPAAFADAFARAWFKLTHRDMGPKIRYLGPEVPAEDLIWQDPIPAVDHRWSTPRTSPPSRPRCWPRACRLPSWCRPPGLRPPPSAARTSAAAPTARASAWPRKRTGRSTAGPTGQGAGGARRHPEGLQCRGPGGKKVSLADLIVLAAGRGRGRRARGGHAIEVPFTPGRTDATAEQTDAESPRARARGRRLPQLPEAGLPVPAEEMLLDKAHLLTLSAPEMTVLVGGLRVLAPMRGQPARRVDRARRHAEQRLLRPSARHGHGLGRRRPHPGFRRARAQERQAGGTGTRVDLVFGSNSQLRALAEVYAQDGAEAKFVRDFVAAWTKVMNLDRFDLR